MMNCSDVSVELVNENKFKTDQKQFEIKINYGDILIDSLV